MAPQSSDVVAGTNATALQYNNLRADVNKGLKTKTASAYTSTVTLNLSLGNLFAPAALTGNVIFAISNATTDQFFTLKVTQDGTGSRLVTWFSTITWRGTAGVTPTLSTAASAVDVYLFLVTGVGTYDGWVVSNE